MNVHPRIRRHGAAGATALAVATLLTACTSTPGAGPATPATSASPATGATRTAPAASTALTWAACGEKLECATLQVPVDHARKGGARTGIALVRHRATDPARRIGVLMTNPGGPGASGVEQVRTGVVPPAPGMRPYFGADILARFDVVGMDPRGIGASNPLDCQSDAERERGLAADSDPDLPGGLPLAALQKQYRDLVRGCLAANDREYLAHLGTDDVARDMDLVRAALGEEKITYLGLSYGTLLGVTYAHLFPARVRHMVLDAPAHPVRWQADPLKSTEEQAVSAERQLDLYFETCRKQRAQCRFGDGDPARAFDRLVDALEARPLTVPASPPLPKGRVDGASVLGAARVGMFSPQLWPALTSALVAAEKGDGRIVHALTALLARDRDGTPNALIEGNLAVNCLDRVRPDRRAMDVQAERLRRVAPRFGPSSAYSTLGCQEWPAGDAQRVTGPYTGAGAPPVLVVGGRLDSQTPYPWAQAMAEALDGAVLLTRTGVGHGSYGSRLNGACIDDAVDAYLTDGTLPARGTVCEQPPPSTAPAG